MVQMQEVYYLRIILVLLILFLAILWVKKRKLSLRLRHQHHEIAQSLRDKGVLLRELNHRVKNNMQIVSSTLQFMAKKSKSDEVKAALLESELKLHSIQMAQQKITDSSDHDQIALLQYARDLLEVFNQSILANQCTISVTGDHVHVNIEQAQALGFVLHELITNSSRHAWNNARQKKISVYIRQKSDLVYLVYQDNGEGLPDGFSSTDSDSYGIRFIHSIVKRQLRGAMTFSKNEGAVFTIQFKRR